LTQEKFNTEAYNSSCIKVYIGPHDGLQLELKHVAVNKLIKLVLYVADLIHVIC